MWSENVQHHIHVHNNSEIKVCWLNRQCKIFMTLVLSCYYQLKMITAGLTVHVLFQTAPDNEKHCTDWNGAQHTTCNAEELIYMVHLIKQTCQNVNMLKEQASIPKRDWKWVLIRLALAYFNCSLLSNSSCQCLEVETVAANVGNVQSKSILPYVQKPRCS